MAKFHLGLLPRIILAIILGVVFGQFLSMPWVRIFITFNGIFSQFLGFMIPLIIVGLVAPAIADLGSGAGKLLLVTVAIAYADTILAGLLSYGTGSWLFPSMISSVDSSVQVQKVQDIAPYFSIAIPPMLDVMAALVFAFMLGLGIAYSNSTTMLNFFHEFKEIISKTISVAIIPLLPIYIFGIFLNMTVNGEAYHIMIVFAKIICVIIVLHLFILLYLFVFAGGVVKKNPFKLLWNMVPAYFTALGTSSSAATIPVTLRQTLKNGVSEDIAGFTVPLCATIHMPGSAMKITACALAITMMSGMPHNFGLFLNFIMLLGVCMVAAPGVPGGAIMAALGPLASILGFDAQAQALMIALYIAMDSFGTACNVTGDGAISLIIDRLFKKKTV